MAEHPDLPRHIRAREHTASVIAHFVLEAIVGGERPVRQATRGIRNPGEPVPPLEYPDSMMQEIYDRIYDEYSDQNLIDQYWAWCASRSGVSPLIYSVLHHIAEDFASDGDSDILAPSAELVPDRERDATLAQLPRTTLREGMLHTDREPACSICLEAVDIGAEVLRLRCEHWFHPTCVVTWLKGSQDCPLCRDTVDL